MIEILIKHLRKCMVMILRYTLKPDMVILSIAKVCNNVSCESKNLYGILSKEIFEITRQIEYDGDSD